MTKEEIQNALPARYRDIELRYFPSVDSTNAYLKRERENLPGRTLVVADSQTAGRGRLGRAFASPGETGLYMSVLFKAPPEKTVKLTLACAVAVCRAIEKETGLKPQIKWVNDVFLCGRKVCGILCEAVSNDVIAGIGVNVRTPQGGFPAQISAVAGSVADALAASGEEKAIDRSRLAGEIAGELLALKERLDAPELIDEYRARSLLIGREIVYERLGRTYRARVRTVDENGALCVLRDDGVEERLFTGEVSLGSAAVARKSGESGGV